MRPRKRSAKNTRCGNNTINKENKAASHGPRFEREGARVGGGGGGGGRRDYLAAAKVKVVTAAKGAMNGQRTRVFIVLLR